MRKFYFLLVAVMFVVVSCKKDDENNKEAIKDVSKSVQNIDTEVVNVFNEVNNEEAVVALKAVSELMKISDFPTTLPSVLNVISQNINPEGFALDESPKEMPKGTFTWDDANQKWIYSSEPTDATVMKFPLDKSNPANNNALIEVKDLEYVKFKSFGYVLKSIQVKIEVNGNVVGMMSHDSSWESTMNVPVTVNTTAVLGTFKMQMAVAFTMPKYNVAFSFAKGANVITSANMSLSLNLPTMKPVFVKEAKGFYQFATMKFDGTVDVAGIALFGKGVTLDEINSKINVTLKQYPSDKSVGKIYVKTIDAKGEPVFVVKMDDGTEIELMPLVIKIIAKLPVKLNL